MILNNRVISIFVTIQRMASGTDFLAEITCIRLSLNMLPLNMTGDICRQL